MTIVKNIFFGLLTLFFLVTVTRNFFEYQRNLEFYNGFKTEYDEVKAQNDWLQAQFVKQNDPDEVEKTIRNQLNMVKDGETVVLMEQPSPTPIQISPTEIPNYTKWYRTFFD